MPDELLDSLVVVIYW